MAVTKFPTTSFDCALKPSDQAMVSASVLRYGFSFFKASFIPLVIFICSMVPSLLNFNSCTQTERVNPLPPGKPAL